MNCSSTGTIIYFGGGIVGSGCNNTNIIGCSSSGIVEGGVGGGGGGGIVGAFCGTGVIVDQCYSTGSIVGSNAGGIIASGGLATVTNCYSTGSIGVGCGGIFGANAGNGASATGCYSTGSIGPTAGGIFGTSSTFGVATNCYSTGTINGLGNGGGIFGATLSGVNPTNCYTSGSNNGTNGGIVAGQSIDNQNGSGNYSESSNGNSGNWSQINATLTLQNIGTIWQANPNIGDSYYLRKMGVTPYSTAVIQTTPTPSLIAAYIGPSIAAGATTNPAIVSGYTFTLLVNPQIGLITINASTGAISVDPATPVGSYTLRILNQINPYAITTYELTVTAEPPPPTPTTNCCPTYADIQLNTEVPYSLIETVRVGKTLIVERQRNPTYQFQTYSDFMKYKITLANKRLYMVSHKK